MTIPEALEAIRENLRADGLYVDYYRTQCGQYCIGCSTRSDTQPSTAVWLIPGTFHE